MDKNKLVKTSLLCLVIASGSLTLQGCPAIIVGAAGGTAMAAHDRRNADTILEDEAIEVSVTDKLYGDDRLYKKIHVNATSYNHVLLLTGEVTEASLKDYAIELIQNTTNVRRIHNYITVGPLTSLSSRTNDSWITSKVKADMIATKGFSSSRIKVVTENATVFLMGLVTGTETEKAVEITRNVKGVARVVKLFEYIREPEIKPTAINEK